MTLSVRPIDSIGKVGKVGKVVARVEREVVLSRSSRRLLTPVLIGLAVVSAAVQLFLIWAPLAVGLDFIPLRNAADALLHGHSVYTDPLFVYPPTAAVPMVPFALGAPDLAFRAWVLLSVVALVASAALIARARPSGRLMLTAALSIALVGGSVAFDSLLLGNMSPMLVPFAVLTLLSFERGEWTRGCAFLALSLLIKPLLAPLLLLPIMRRQWRALALSLGPAALALLAAYWLVPGAGQLSRVARFVLGGTNLHGKNAVNNLSLQGWGEFQRHPLPALLAAMAVALVGGLGLVLWTRRGTVGDGRGAAQIGTAVMLTVFLAGRISEVHFLLAVMATMLLAIVLRPSWRLALPALPAFAIMVLPHQLFAGLAHPGPHLQSAYVVAQVLLLVACLRPVLTRR